MENNSNKNNSSKPVHIAQSKAVEVVIAGLGPTGLVLAHILGKRGHQVLVLEREPKFYGNARAVYTDDECMRIFQSIDMADELQKDMLLDTPVQLTKADGSVMSQYKPLKRPNGWPVVNFFYQPYLESTLTEALSRYPNVEVYRSRELVTFTQNEKGISVEHHAVQQYRFSDGHGVQTTGDGHLDPQRIHAQYLIGADGGRSTVRTQLGIEMDGKNFPEPWLVVDLKQKDPNKGLRHLPYFNFVTDPDLPVVSCVQPDGHHRFEFMLTQGQTPEYMERPETVRELLSKYVNPDDFEVKRKLVYTFNALVAKQWRDKRVFLAGDAAHMTPQFMGQGASSGIRDAYNLGWKLSDVLHGHAGDALLDTYTSERLNHAKAMIDSSVFLKDLVSMRNPLGTKLRDGVIKTIQMVPFLRKWAEEGGFKPEPIYQQGQYFGLPRLKRHAAEGTLAPQPEVRGANGKRMRMDDVLGGSYVLIGIGCDPTVSLTAQSLQILDQINTQAVYVHAYACRPQGRIERDFKANLIEVEDIQQELTTWLRKHTKYTAPQILILRPDRFVFALTLPESVNEAIQQLHTQLYQSSIKPSMHQRWRPLQKIKAYKWAKIT